MLAALRWLARHQNADGSWSVDTYVNQCTGGKCTGVGEADFDAGVTGLSVLAFLGAGYTHLSRDQDAIPFGPVVKKGVQWLMAHQDDEGCVGARGPKHMYSHAIASLALAEAYGMTATELLKAPAQKAIDYLVAAQNPGRGWRYSARCGDNDTSVTGWAVMALKSAELSELNFPRTCYDGALAWLNAATDGGGYYAVGYNGPGTGKVFVNGKNEQFSGNPAMSAVSVMSRIFITRKRGDPALASVNLMLGALPEWKPEKIDYYYWYYASLALFQYDGPNGPVWKRWNEPMKNAIIPNQKTARHGCANGSWDSDCERWGFEGGRVYATAINALTLEVYYRYANVFGGAGSK